MPRAITEMPDPKPRGNRKYAWEEWAIEGNRLAFVEGEDFDCKPSSFEVQVRSEAAKRNLSATVLEDPDASTEDATVLAVEFKAPKPSTDEPTEAVEDAEDTDES